MSKCIKELTLDFKNYIEGGTVCKRKVVRGIARQKDKYLVIYEKSGDYKFPGGETEEGESLTDTLAREVQEETGYKVIAQSITDYFLVHEKRRGKRDDLLEMDTWCFLCEVEAAAGEQNLDEYEKECNLQAAWLSLCDIIQKNEAIEQYEKFPWIVRETMIMRELQEWKA